MINVWEDKRDVNIFIVLLSVLGVDLIKKETLA